MRAIFVILSLGLVIGCGDRVVVSNGASGGGAATGGASTGSGDPGGGGAAASPRVVTVTNSSGAPEEGAEVVAHDASGAVLDHQTTGDDGTVTVVVPDDGMVTLAYQIVELFPGPGGTTHEQQSRLFTFAAIGDRTALSHRMEQPRAVQHNPPMTVELVTNVPSAIHLLVVPSCEDGAWQAPSVGAASYDLRGCSGEATFDLMLLASDVDAHYSKRKVFGAIPHEPGTTLTLSLDESDLVPTPADHLFEAADGHALGAIIFGYDAAGGFRTYTPSGPPSSSPVSVATPPTTGVATWRVVEHVPELSQARSRMMTTVPASSSWTVEPLARASAPAVEVAPRLTASWEYARGGLAGDAVDVEWQGLGGSGPTVWHLLLPPGAATAAFPALPPMLEHFAPSDGLVQVVVIDSLTGDRATLFDSVYADRAHAWSEITSLP